MGKTNVYGHVPLRSWLLMNPKEREHFNMSIQFGGDLKVERLHGRIVSKASKERRIVYGKISQKGTKGEPYMAFKGPWEGDPEEAPVSAFFASEFSGVCLSEPAFRATSVALVEAVITARLVGALCLHPEGSPTRTRLFLKDLRGAETHLDKEYHAELSIVLSIGEAIQFFEKRHPKDRLLRFAGKEISECNLLGQ